MSTEQTHENAAELVWRQRQQWEKDENWKALKESYEQAADHIAASPEPESEAERFGKFQGEIDHRITALGYEDLHQSAYDRQMELARLEGYEDGQGIAQESGHPETLEEAGERAVAQYRAASERSVELVDDRVKDYPLLSQDDWMHSYEKGGREAANDYFKTWKGVHEMDIANVLEDHKSRIERQWADALGRASDGDEVEAVDAHFVGAAHGYNALREQTIERSPDVEKALPPAIDVDETSRRLMDKWLEKAERESRDIQSAETQESFVIVQ